MTKKGQDKKNSEAETVSKEDVGNLDTVLTPRAITGEGGLVSKAGAVESGAGGPPVEDTPEEAAPKATGDTTTAPEVPGPSPRRIYSEAAPTLKTNGRGEPVGLYPGDQWWRGNTHMATWTGNEWQMLAGAR